MRTLYPRQVLMERERWAAETQAALAAGARSVVRLSARMPATLRLRGLADSPVTWGAAAFAAECGHLGFSLQPIGHAQGALGPWVLWASYDSPRLLKQVGLLLEEGSSQGQLVDVDVYSQEGPVSRSLLGLKPRRCIVCGEAAAVCSGRSVHAPSIVHAAFLNLLECAALSLSNTAAPPYPGQCHGIPQIMSCFLHPGSPDGYAVGAEPPLNIREISIKGGDTP